MSQKYYTYLFIDWCEWSHLRLYFMQKNMIPNLNHHCISIFPKSKNQTKQAKDILKMQTKPEQNILFLNFI